MKTRFVFTPHVLAWLGALLATPLLCAQVAEPAHPVMSIPGNGSGADGILSNYSEAQFLRYVPEWAPRNSANGFAAAVVPGDTGWTWNIASPDQLTSTPSGTVFPNSAYPLQFQPLAVLSGKTVNIPFNLAAGSTTRKSFVPSAISYNKLLQLRRFLDTLAPAYVNSGTTAPTRNDAYARRIALALDSWADFVPDYFMTTTNSPTLVSAEGFTTVDAPGLSSQTQRASDHNGLAHEWDESELFAFDAIYDSKALTDLSVEKGYDVREHIKSGLLFNIGDFLKDRVPVSTAIATNLSSPFSILAKTARVLNRPDYILWMGDYLDATIRRKLDRDGVLPEGIGYSYNYLAENVDASNSTRDYFLTRSADTPELQRISTAAASYVPILQKGLNAWKAARLPDGTHSSFGDTNFDSITGRNAGSTTLLPSYGHLAFGTGSGGGAVQLNQNFSDDSNHMRSDVAAYTLWANDAELLGNIRYYNGLAGRNFTEQILAYNAVTIDRANMSRGTWNVGNNNHKFTSGNLAVYEPMNTGISVSEIDGSRPYANKASRYQRLMILNTVDADRPYVVDVFRVTGGTTHDYTVHGAIRFDQTGGASFPLTPMPGAYPLLENGETWVEPTSSSSTFPYYGFFRNENQGTAPANFQITYRDTSASKHDLRLWMTGEAGSTVYLGTTPNPSRNNSTPANFYTYSRPSTIVRHRIDSGSLESLYVSVAEPMANGASTIRAVARVPLASADKEAVALRVWFADGRFDTYLVNLHNPAIAGASGGTETIATADGEYALTGRVGVYSSRSSGGSRVWTVGASNFKYGNRVATNSTPSYSGNIVGMTRKIDGEPYDAFIVDAPLSAGTALQGRQLSLTFGDYQVVGSATIQKGMSEMFQIDHVELVGGQTYVVLTADHQLKMSDGTTTEQVAPERTFTGTNTFQIVLASSAATEATPTPALPSDAPPPDSPGGGSEPPDPTSPAKLTIPASSVTASAFTSTFVPTNTVDGSLSTRWAGNGDGVWIRYDLGALKTVNYVKVAWFQGATRTYTFDLQVSTDATNWTNVLTGAKNTATAALETYDFTNTSARYVRLVGHRNTADNYCNIAELEVWGTLPLDLTPPTLSLPANILADSTSASGAMVTFTVGANDDFDGAISALASPASGSLFPIGTTTVSVTATDAAGNKSIGSFTVTVRDASPIQTYAAWSAAHGLNGVNNAFLADPEVDGIANLLEYFLGLNPTGSDPIGLPTASIEGDDFVFRFNRALIVTNATYRVLVSSDLTNWTLFSPVPAVESSTPTSETCVARIPLNSSRQFARLEVTSEDTTVATVPLGVLRFAVIGGTPTTPATTVFGVPLNDTSVPPAGLRAGLIDSFTTSTLTSTSGGWSNSSLATAANPWLVRLTSGGFAGKLLDVTANTETTLTVNGADLTSLGLIAGTDTFELVPMDTLISLFGSSTLLGGTSATVADNVLVRSGATWLAYFYDTNLGFWRRTIGPATNSNNVRIRPDTGLQILRRGPGSTLTLIGRVPTTAFRPGINNATTTVIHDGFPIDTTLGALALQTLLPNWRNAANVTAADTVLLFRDGAWVTYFHNGSFWQNLDGANSDDVAIPVGALLTIQRPGTATGTTELVRLQPYSL